MATQRALLEFVDPYFLVGKRPKIPGGEWTLDALRKKSIHDLQQIWFTVLKEKNKVNTMERHYIVHQETLGAMPAPSRKELLIKSQQNIKKVMRERHDMATEKAMQIFEERLQKGIYRYPPGPQPPPKKTTSRLLLITEAKPEEDSIREAFGTPEVFESHKGIVNLSTTLPEDVLEKKRRAYNDFEEWYYAKQAHQDYYRFNNFNSALDDVEIEIAPGVFSKGTCARNLRVPARSPPQEPPTDVMKRIEWEGLSILEKNTIQLDFFPNLTSEAPSPPGPRPKHPDEIFGPWETTVVFDNPTRARKMLVKLKNVDHVGGVKLVNCKECDDPPVPYATQCPMYEEARNKEKAYQLETQNNPNLTEWNNKYKRPFQQSLADIICYNYNNKVDYAEREARLMNQDLWESPVPIDHTCGKLYQVPTWVSERDQWDADIARFPMELERY